MNSLHDLRKFFQENKIEVTEFTGFSMTADQASWGLAFENPFKDGVEMTPEMWKEYAKGIKNRVAPVTS